MARCEAPPAECEQDMRLVVNGRGQCCMQLCKYVDSNTGAECSLGAYHYTPKIPADCVSWYDGCNTCTVANGQLGACTEMACFRQDAPSCKAYAQPKQLSDKEAKEAFFQSLKEGSSCAEQDASCPMA